MPSIAAMKPVRATAAIANAPRVAGESQPLFPPWISAKVRVAAHTVKNAAPAQSMGPR